MLEEVGDMGSKNIINLYVNSIQFYKKCEKYLIIIYPNIKQTKIIVSLQMYLKKECTVMRNKRFQQLFIIGC